MSKIYHIEKIRRNTKLFTGAQIITYGTWLATLISSPSLKTLPPLIAYTTICILKGFNEDKMIKTEEFKRFKEIYKEILQQYIKLNKDFDFKSPIELYTFFNFVIANDILSINQDRNTRYTRYDRFLIRELTLNGHGVCRHISTMLTDVYKEFNLESSLGICIQPTYETKIIQGEEISEELKKMIIEMQNNIQLEVNGEVVTPDEIIITPTLQIIEEEKKICRKEKKYGNHAITIVNDDKNTYYFDASNGGIYIPSEENKTVLYNEFGNEIKLVERGIKKYNALYGLEEVQIKPTKDFSEMFDESIIASRRIDDNLDMVTDFQRAIESPLKEAEEIHKLILK